MAAAAGTGQVVGVRNLLAVDWREWMSRPRLSYAIFYILYIVTSLTGHRVLHHSIEENPDKTPLLAIRLLLF